MHYKHVVNKDARHIRLPCKFHASAEIKVTSGCKSNSLNLKPPMVCLYPSMI